MTEYAKLVWQYRYFWLALVKFDLVLRYRRSFLGVGWSLVQPLGMAAILCLMFHRIFEVDVKEYGPFILASMTLWAFLSQLAATGCQCFIQAQPYIRQHSAPLAIYPLQVSLGAVLHLVISLGVVVAMTVLVRGPVALATLPALIPVVTLLTLLGWALATMAGIANIYFRDTEHALPVAMQALFYVTPVIYPTELLRSRGMDWLAVCNPFAIVLDLARTPLLQGQFPTAADWLRGCGVVLAAVIVAATLLARVHRQLALRL